MVRLGCHCLSGSCSQSLLGGASARNPWWDAGRPEVEPMVGCWPAGSGTHGGMLADRKRADSVGVLWPCLPHCGTHRLYPRWLSPGGEEGNAMCPVLVAKNSLEMAQKLRTPRGQQWYQSYPRPSIPRPLMGTTDVFLSLK